MEKFDRPPSRRTGKHIYYMRGYVGQPEREFAVIDRDVATGVEKEIIRSGKFEVRA